MLEANKPKAEFLNIMKWRNWGFNGEGVTIGVINGPMWTSAPFMDGVVSNPLGMRDVKDNSHALYTADWVHQCMPAAKIIALPDQHPESPGVIDSLKYVIDNKLDLIYFPCGGINNAEVLPWLKAVYDAGIPIIVSAGNDKLGDGNTLSVLSHLGFTLSVGAALYNAMSKKITRAEYSSVGPDLDIMGLSSIMVHSAIKDDYLISWDGTSFSAPTVVAELTAYIQWFKKRTNCRPTMDDVLKFVFDHCIDMGVTGKDDETGAGLFCLPDTLPPDPVVDPVAVLQINNVTAKINGINTLLDTPPIIKNDRTLVPLRVIAEALGAKVEWDAGTIRIYGGSIKS